MKLVALSVLVVSMIATITPSQAEIMCTLQGCFETGRRIFLSGSNAYPGMTVINRRQGEKDFGKPVRINRVYQGGSKQ